MAGVLDLVVEQTARPQGHGYVEAEVDRAQPVLRRPGTRLRGHEFHYSRVVAGRRRGGEQRCGCAAGEGSAERRDGLVKGRVWASYLHLHALGTPSWATALHRSGPGLPGGARTAPASGADRPAEPAAAGTEAGRRGDATDEPERRVSGMGLKEEVRELLRQGREEALAELAAARPRGAAPADGPAVGPRRRDPAPRRVARWACAAATHEDLGLEIIRRLMWALNDESATNGVYGIPALGEIGRRAPEMLAPYVPALVSMAWDDGTAAGTAARAARRGRARARAVEPHAGAR